MKLRRPLMTLSAKFSIITYHDHVTTSIVYKEASKEEEM